MSASALEDKLRVALDSRRARNILRRLPSPERKNKSVSSKGGGGDGDDNSLADFVSNDYLSLASSPTLRSKFLDALHASPSILGSRGSRLLVNPAEHDALELRLCSFFHAKAALLFNSGFDANAGVFASLPQPGDVAVVDEAIHASVHDGLRASRLSALRTFTHNDIDSLRDNLLNLLGGGGGGSSSTSTSAEAHANAQRAASLRNGTSSVFVAVEALYSMDGTLAPLPAIVTVLDALFPRGNAHLIVDEAHATGLFGPGGRGLVAHYGLEDRVLVRVHTFGKALASSGAVVLTNELIKSYLLNYARPLIYTTALSCANVVAINCSFDLLEDETASELATKLGHLVQYTLTRLRQELALLPPNLVSLPPHLQGQDPGKSTKTPSSHLFTPIIPIMTPLPRPLSAHLRARGLNARPITWPTVPKGKDRVRVCLHAGNTREEVDSLCDGIREWARAQIEENKGSRENVGIEGGFIEAKL